MIHYITSTCLHLIHLRAHAEVTAMSHADATRRAIVVELDPRPHDLEAEQGEVLLVRHEADPALHIIVVSLAELPLLRLLRRVGEGRLSPNDLQVVVLTLGEDGFVRAVEIDVDDAGEFTGLWPDGFFDARHAELFY